MIDNPAIGHQGAGPAIEFDRAGLLLGQRWLWSGLDLTLAPGEFLALLGPNGSGKSSLLKVLLGQLGLSAGSVRLPGAQHAGRSIGYVPQQGTTEDTPVVRAVDFVGFGLDGHRWGTGLRGRAERKRRVAEALAAVDATALAGQPVERLSGGERQRLRIAQALVGDPEVLLCDEPLLSLDFTNQHSISELIDKRRHDSGTTVVFVTHEINTILPFTDRVLYLYGGEHRLGTVDEVMNSRALSGLFDAPVEVFRAAGQIHIATGQAAALGIDNTQAQRRP